MKQRLTVAGLLLVASAALSGCGGEGGGAPTDASEADFCDAFTTFGASAAGDADDTEAQITALKDAASELADVGTPEGIPDDAREGFELFVDTLDGVDENASEEELDAIGDDLDDDDEALFEAFTNYAGETCAAL